MIYIFIGILGYVAGLGFDFILLKKIPRIKLAVWLAGWVFAFFSIIMVSLNTDKFSMPLWTLYPGWVLFGLGTLFILYALYLNLPFKSTYVNVTKNAGLIKTGLYALCRHPVNFWINLVMISLILISRSKLMLIEAPLFIILNTALVVIEDKFIFPQIFTDYKVYQRETPMLLPNVRSIKAFVNTLTNQRVRPEESNEF